MPGGLPFRNAKPLIGMIHLSGSNGEIVKRAMKELEIYDKEGLDGAIVENYCSKDVQKVREVLHASKDKFKLTIGVNILPNEFGTAFSLAEKYSAKFVQLDYVAGIYDGVPRGIDVLALTAARRQHGEIAVLGGVHPKYYVPRSDLKTDLFDGVALAEVIVVTGEGTGIETPLDKIKTFRRHIGGHPLYVGAGLTAENALEQLRIADGAIVGSYFKEDGDANSPVDGRRVRELVSAVKTLRPLR